MPAFLNGRFWAGGSKALILFFSQVCQKATLGEFEVQLYDLLLLKELIGWFLPWMHEIK